LFRSSEPILNNFAKELYKETFISLDEADSYYQQVRGLNLFRKPYVISSSDAFFKFVNRLIFLLILVLTVLSTY
jgi:hypothetical protein